MLLPNSWYHAIIWTRWSRIAAKNLIASAASLPSKSRGRKWRAPKRVLPQHRPSRGWCYGSDVRLRFSGGHSSQLVNHCSVGTETLGYGPLPGSPPERAPRQTLRNLSPFQLTTIILTLSFSVPGVMLCQDETPKSAYSYLKLNRYSFGETIQVTLINGVSKIRFQNPPSFLSIVQRLH